MRLWALRDTIPNLRWHDYDLLANTYWRILIGEHYVIPDNSFLVFAKLEIEREEESWKKG